MEWAWGAVPILFDALETNSKQRFGIVDHGNFGVQKALVIFIDLNACIQKTAIEGL